MDLNRSVYISTSHTHIPRQTVEGIAIEAGKIPTPRPPTMKLDFGWGRVRPRARGAALVRLCVRARRCVSASGARGEFEVKPAGQFRAAGVSDDLVERLVNWGIAYNNRAAALQYH